MKDNLSIGFFYSWLVVHVFMYSGYYYHVLWIIHFIQWCNVSLASLVIAFSWSHIIFFCLQEMSVWPVMSIPSLNISLLNSYNWWCHIPTLSVDSLIINNLVFIKGKCMCIYIQCTCIFYYTLFILMYTELYP